MLLLEDQLEGPYLKWTQLAYKKMLLISTNATGETLLRLLLQSSK